MNNNDIKYVMLPRIEDKARVVKPQPWYKERLREKYLKNKDKIIDPKQWIFIKGGLDDFRDGLPPQHDDLIIKPTKGPGPTIKNDKWKYKENAVPVSGHLSTYQRCYSKKIPLTETKEDYINQILEDLDKHPLALYPHLEEGIPHELFEEILDILDPEISRPSRNQNESSFSHEHRSGDSIEKVESKVLDEDSQLYRRNIREESQRLEEFLKKNHEEKKKVEAEKKEIKNNYKWLLKKEDAKARSKGPEPEQVKAQAIDAHIKKVTEQFCDWVKSLGGEHNIDQLTLTTLFASGYDTKPPLSVPINIVELTNIPAELRPHVSVPTQDNSEDQLAKKIYRQEDTGKKHGIRYGAWYLGKEHWQKMPINEKLIDPKVKNDSEKIEAKKKYEDINSRLAPLHGAQAFKKFVKEKKPQRVPRLVEDLEDWEGEQIMKSQAAAMASQDSKWKKKFQRDDFDESLIIDSFDSCGITGQSHLHSTLKNLVNNNLIFNSYIDDLEEEEDILGLDNVDEIDVNLRELVLEENTSIEANQSSPEQLITSPEQSQIQSYQNPPNSTPINIQTPETDENVNQIGSPVTSNEAQPRLNGRYVLKELNNQQNVNQPNVSNSSSITIQKLPKKRGRKPLPRDENGKIIRQQNL